MRAAATHAKSGRSAIANSANAIAAAPAPTIARLAFVVSMSSPPGILHDQTYQTTRAQHKSNVRRVPPAVGEMHRDKGAEAGEESGQKEIQPIECVQA